MDVYIPGCSPRPEAVLQYLNQTASPKFKRLEDLATFAMLTLNVPADIYPQTQTELAGAAAEYLK